METIQILPCMMILMSESDNRYTSINKYKQDKPVKYFKIGYSDLKVWI
jgi:hypothetical protein